MTSVCSGTARENAARVAASSKVGLALNANRSNLPISLAPYLVHMHISHRGSSHPRAAEPIANSRSSALLLLDQQPQSFLHRGPALLAEPALELALRRFPEWQRPFHRGPAGGGQRQDPAAVSTLGSELNVSPLLQRPQIARQRRAFHLQRIGERFDRESAACADRGQHGDLRCPQVRRPKR